MTPVVSFAGFKAVRCEKVSCTTGSFKLHRHHMASEKMFLDVLHGRYHDQKWYQQLTSNYYAFREKDVVHICEPHHAEIHHRYNKLVGKYIRANGPPQNWTKRQAENLMSILRAECQRWLRAKSAGYKGGFKQLKAERTKEKKERYIRLNDKDVDPNDP
jgi:hypothetical protein